MRKRSIIIIAIAALLVAAGVSVGVWQGRAQGEPSLTAVTPAQLLTNVEQHAKDVASVSGAVSWKNDLLSLSMLSSFGGQTAGDFTALLTAGSGRVWVENGKIRFEIQGSGGDTTITGDSNGLWVYDSSKNTATEYTLPAQTATQGAETSTTIAPTGATDPVTAMESVLQKLAPTASLTVSDAVKVAGRDCYVLSLVPKASTTIFGSVQVSIDAETYLPLKISVFAKGDTKPVLTAGFTSVSYAQIADSIFAFTPPATATIEHKTLSLPSGFAAGEQATGSSDAAAKASSSDTSEGSLTLADAAVQAGFTPLAPSSADPALAFGGASVIPAKQVDLQSLLAKLPAMSGSFLGAAAEAAPQATAGASSSVSAKASADPLKDLAAALPSGPVDLGPTVVQRYGEGFGTIVLAQAKLPVDLSSWLDQTLSSIPLLAKTTAGNFTVYVLGTSLGSIAVWDKDGMLFAAAGSVSSTDIEGFIASVR